MKLLRQCLLPLVIVLLVTACSEDSSPPAQVVRPVKAMTVGDVSAVVERSFPAKVEAYQVADLAFQVPGQIIQFPVKQGEQVQQAALLAKLDPKEYQHRVDEFQAKYDLAVVEFQRAEKLIEGNYVSKADYDKRRTEMDVTLTNLNTAKKDLNDTVLTAPFDGIVAVTYVESFENVKAKENILRFQDISKIDLVIDVPEDVMINISQDQTVETQAVFRSLGDKPFPLTYKEHATEADPDTQTYRVELTMEQPKELNILPGMTATVQVEMPDPNAGQKGLFVVPSSAVFQDGAGQDSVWVIDKDSMKVHQQAVKVGKLVGNNINIRSGINVGDTIVTAGVHYLREGQEVTLMRKGEFKQ